MTQKIAVLVFLFSTLLLCLTCQTTESNPADTNNETVVSNDNYQEPHRPQFHFSPDSMWMNDPNGMVYYAGEYHLFYQYYPDSTVWGPMHWGHAVSTDLIHWEHLPIGLYPDSLGYIFSGSAVIDWDNTSGLGTDDQPPMIAIFTYHDMAGERAERNDFQTQGIAYSNDKGRTWTKYAGNPVITNPGIRDFRDPKVFWHEASQRWVMVFARGDQLQFYNSPNLITWTLTSEFGLGHGSQARPWECPDLFELPIVGTDESDWVLLVSLGKGGPNGGSATQYFIGDFDGKTFTNANSADSTLWIDYGRDNYAGVTWSDIPKEDGRRLFIGWMSNWQYAQVVPTERWRSAMTLPRQLQLERTPVGSRLASIPVEETKKLRTGPTLELSPQPLTGDLALTDQLTFSPTLVEIELEVALPEVATTDFGLEFSNAKGEAYRVGYNAATNQFYSDRRQAGKLDFSEDFAQALHVAPRMASDRTVSLHLFVDISSAEVFADGGLTVMTDLFFPTEPFTRLKLYTKNGDGQLVTGTIYALQSIWTGATTY